MFGVCLISESFTGFSNDLNETEQVNFYIYDEPNSD